MYSSTANRSKLSLCGHVRTHRVRTLRAGFTLLELLVVVAIIAVMIGLVLAAIQRTRVEATRLQSLNNLRQIVFGVHQLADERAGVVKGLTKAELPRLPVYSEQSLFRMILPWTHAKPSLPANPTSADYANLFRPEVPIYKSPGDPTLSTHPGLAGFRGVCSYGFNMQAVDGGLSIPISCPDGLTSTLCVAEKYFVRPDPEMYHDYGHIEMPTPPNEVYGRRRATFADRGWHDVVPVTDPATRATRASVPGKTFQVRPPLDRIDPHVPQTPFAAGLPVALFDGSVRTLSPSIDESVFWSLVTPNGGEVVGDF